MSKTIALQLVTYDKSSSGEYTVSEISTIIRGLIEENISFVKIRGEISGLKVAPSGHAYFSLKDSGAVLSAICWKGVFNTLAFKPKEGLEVICIGSLTTYAGQSKYQMIVNALNPAGIGALMAMLEKLKQNLAKEGLFDAKYKKPLPYLPKIIGIVTSASGAVIKDILHRIKNRFPTHVLLWPVLVQGEGAASQITKAIEGFNKLNQHGIELPDIIIVARGGGSIEDLWAFNEEIVARAVFNSKIPIISAVGHETDTTLIDYVADVRAPTPTAAAEIAVQVRIELIQIIYELKIRTNNSISRYIAQKTLFIDSISKNLRNLKSALSYYTQKLDELSLRLVESFPRIYKNLSKNIMLIFNKIKPPKEHLASLNKTLLYQQKTFECAAKQFLLIQEHKLELVSKLLKSYSYENTLTRGFSIVRDKKGNIIKSIKVAQEESTITIQLSDGNLNAKICYS